MRLVIDFKKELNNSFRLFFNLDKGLVLSEKELGKNYLSHISNASYEIDEKLIIKKDSDQMPSNLLRNFKKEIESIHYFGSTTYGPKNEYGDIDVNICLNSNYFEENYFILPAFKKIIDEFFTYAIGIETDINFSKKLSEPIDTFAGNLTENYARQIIKDYILSGIRIYQKAEKVDVRMINGGTVNSFEYNDCRKIPIEDIYQLNALSLLTESRLVKLAKYSQSSLEYLLKNEHSGQARFEWIEKDLSKDEIMLNSLKCYVLNPKLFLENLSLFKWQKKREFNVNKVDKNLVKFIACMSKENEITLQAEKKVYSNLLFKIMNAPIVEGLSLENVLKNYLTFEFHESNANQMGAISNFIKFDCQMLDINPAEYVKYKIKYSSKIEKMFLKSIAKIMSEEKMKNPFKFSYLLGYGLGEQNINKLLQVSL